MRSVFLKAILIYQKSLSPFLSSGPLGMLLPNSCAYHPTCSEYMYQAIKTHGIIPGLTLGTKRLLRCNPWTKGGIDPVPKNPTHTSKT